MPGGQDTEAAGTAGRKVMTFRVKLRMGASQRKGEANGTSRFARSGAACSERQWC